MEQTAVGLWFESKQDHYLLTKLMYMRDEKLIKSVMGFNFNIAVKDENNQMVKTGIKYTIQRAEGSIAAFKNRVADKKWFTHFNDGLYNKILDYRKNND